MGGKDRANIRELILECLNEVTENGTYSHVILNDVLNKYAYLPKKDRSFLTIVFEGTLERLITIDYILNAFSKTPVAKMKPLIRNLLRSAVYQICYLDGVYDSEVVNESVKLAGKRGFKGLQGFVNGLLRNIARNKDNIKLPDPDSSPVEFLSVKYSMPEWIIRKWMSVYDRDTVEGILISQMEHPATTIRINRNTDIRDLEERMRSLGISMDETCLSNARTISGYDRLTEVPGFAEGLFQIQDLSSIRVGNLISEFIDLNGKNVIDVCAAPGGKSLHMWDLGANITSCDISAKKTELIRQNFARAGAQTGCEGNGEVTEPAAVEAKTEVSGAGNIRILIRDASVPDPELVNAYDVVLCDAPCSGLGVLSRKADIKYRLQPEDTLAVAGLQGRILDNVVDYVRPGGLLVFSTCTINTEENEAHRDRILGMGGFELLHEEQRLPGRDPGDGFYITIFKKSPVKRNFPE